VSEILIGIFQGVSSIALLKLCVDLGKVLQRIEHHEKRLDRIEERL
jgi:hypothetical protein